MSELIKHFANHREEIWAELRNHLENGGDIWDGAPFRVKHGPFTIVLDRNAEGGGYATRMVTRIRAAFINRDGFRGRLRRSNWMTDLATMLGTQDLKIGDEQFDAEFVIQASEPRRVERLLADTGLRKMLIKAPIDLCEVRSDEGVFGPEFPNGVDELYAHSREVLETVEDVETLYEAFADVLNRLCHLGSAYEDDPHIDL